MYIYDLSDLSRITTEVGGLHDNVFSYHQGQSVSTYSDKYGVEQIFYSSTKDTTQTSDVYLSLVRVFLHPGSDVWDISHFRNTMNVPYTI